MLFAVHGSRNLSDYIFDFDNCRALVCATIQNLLSNIYIKEKMKNLTKTFDKDTADQWYNSVSMTSTNRAVKIWNKSRYSLDLLYLFNP